MLRICRQLLCVSSVVVAVCALQAPAAAAGMITSVNAGGGAPIAVAGVNSTNPLDQTGALVTAYYSGPTGQPPETVSVNVASTASGLGWWTLGILSGSDYQLNAAAFPSLTGIVALEINLVPAGAAFDIDGLAQPPLPPLDTGTPGSLLGIPPQLNGAVGIWDIGLTFYNPIQIGATPPVGDLYGKVRIDFSSPFDANDFMDLRIDTDTLLGTPTVIPEPSSFALVGLATLGGLALAWCRRRRRVT